MPDGSVFPPLVERLPRKSAGLLCRKRARDAKVLEIETVSDKSHEFTPLPATLAPAGERCQGPPDIDASQTPDLRPDAVAMQHLRHSGRQMPTQRFQPHAKRRHEVSVPLIMLVLCAIEDRRPFHERAIAVGDRRDAKCRHDIPER